MLQKRMHSTHLKWLISIHIVTIVKMLQKGCTRLAAASDKVYQLLAQGRWFSPGTPASSITKPGRHDIAEILLKVALKHQKSNKIKCLWENSPKITSTNLAR